MTLEDLRKALEPFEYPETLDGVSLFFNTLTANLGKIIPEVCSDYKLSMRQHTVYHNALRLLFEYKKTNNFEHIKQCCSEIYDIAQNYRDTNHILSRAELCLFETLVIIYINLMEVQDAVR